MWYIKFSSSLPSTPLPPRRWHLLPQLGPVHDSIAPQLQPHQCNPDGVLLHKAAEQHCPENHMGWQHCPGGLHHLLHALGGHHRRCRVLRPRCHRRSHHSRPVWYRRTSRHPPTGYSCRNLPQSGGGGAWDAPRAVHCWTESVAMRWWRRGHIWCCDGLQFRISVHCGGDTRSRSGRLH